MIPYINMTNPNIPNVGIRGVRNVNVRMANLRRKVRKNKKKD